MDSDGTPVRFELRQKRNTQDDPLDEYLHGVLREGLPGCMVQRAAGPLISPDMVIARKPWAEPMKHGGELLDASRIIGLEVKKIERQRGGRVSRPSGVDYNSTPPCQRVRVYALNGDPLDIPGFYLFACLEPVEQAVVVTAFVLCVGSALNQDFEYYQTVVGRREKAIGLGTYGDGADRLRPMIIFANPLGFSSLDRAATLVHERADLESQFSELRFVGAIRRQPKDAEADAFVFPCYRMASDVASNSVPFDVTEPFPTPMHRQVRTTRRGMFRINAEGRPLAAEIVPDA
jgi:hypothetical protein